MHALAALTLLGSLASGALAACDASCPPNTIPTCSKDGDTCLAPSVPVKARRAFFPPLLRRDCSTCTPTECPAERKKCTPGGTKPPQIPETKIFFACGQKQTANYVTVTYVNCPGDAANKCLVLTLTGTNLEAPKLEISSQPLRSSNSGQFSYFKPVNYCTKTQCVVPIAEILKREGKTTADLCTLKLWIAIHSGVPGDTCWAMGSEINDGNGNWAEEFNIGFSCPTVPETCCCCPAPPVVQPPKKCGEETAYAKGANTFDLSALGCTNSWGYYQAIPAASVDAVSVGGTVYTANLLAGQTNNVGTVAVTKKSDTCFSLTFDAANGFGVGKVHVDIACKDPNANLGTFCRSPGKYEFQTCVGTDPYTTNTDICAEAKCSGQYYFIIHAETYNVVTYDAANPGPYNNCAAYTC